MLCIEDSGKERSLEDFMVCELELCLFFCSFVYINKLDWTFVNSYGDSQNAVFEFDCGVWLEIKVPSDVGCAFGPFGDRDEEVIVFCCCWLAGFGDPWFLQ